jgi:hypothetical protein
MRFLSATLCRIVFLPVMALMAVHAHAEDSTDDEKIRQCAADICQTVGGPRNGKGQLACLVSKTWDGQKINKAAAEKKLSWTYGDPACTLDLKVDRALLVSAVTADTYTLKVPAHKVSCEVIQNGTKTPVHITLAPEVKVKNGQVTAVLLKVSTIEAPALIKSVIWSAAKLEDNFGIYHGDLVRGINTFVNEECPKMTAADAGR